MMIGKRMSFNIMLHHLICCVFNLYDLYVAIFVTWTAFKFFLVSKQGAHT